MNNIQLIESLDNNIKNIKNMPFPKLHITDWRQYCIEVIRAHKELLDFCSSHGIKYPYDDFAYVDPDKESDRYKADSPFIRNPKNRSLKKKGDILQNRCIVVAIMTYDRLVYAYNRHIEIGDYRGEALKVLERAIDYCEDVIKKFGSIEDARRIAKTITG